MKVKILIVLAFIFSLSGINLHAQDIWFTHNFETSEQYEAYLIDLDGDTLHGFIKFTDRISLQNSVLFYKEKGNKKTLTEYKPADLLEYHFLDKTYHCITYSGGLSTTIIKGNLLINQNCISRYVWYDQAEDFSSLRRQAGETMVDFMNRSYPNYYVYYNKAQRKAVNMDYFLMNYTKKMSAFIKENRVLAEKVIKKERGYGNMHTLEIFEKYNLECQK